MNDSVEEGTVRNCLLCDGRKQTGGQMIIGYQSFVTHVIADELNSLKFGIIGWLSK